MDLFYQEATHERKGYPAYRAQFEINGKQVTYMTSPLPLKVGQKVDVIYTIGRFSGAIHVVRVIPAR